MKTTLAVVEGTRAHIVNLANSRASRLNERLIDPAIESRSIAGATPAPFEMETAMVLLLLALVAFLLCYPLVLPPLPPSPPALFIWIPVFMLLLLFALALFPVQ
ncbi:hypothetical protein [Oryza sativa Japonica Group]|uniref:Uncharacterized protein n=1 Tax=Oryza sativa subsp. japonica TaxID=39947 RepID=Q8RYJ5_ORYSJ|nr:hypothetical protein [Oryza sativa Japonica Group]